MHTWTRPSGDEASRTHRWLLALNPLTDMGSPLRCRPAIDNLEMYSTRTWALRLARCHVQPGLQLRFGSSRVAPIDAWHA